MIKVSQKSKSPKSIKEREAIDYGADEYAIAPDHGANELPAMEHEYDFEADQQIAWIIDDAVAKTKAIPKQKKTVTLPGDNGADERKNSVSSS